MKTSPPSSAAAKALAIMGQANNQAAFNQARAAYLRALGIKTS